MRTPFAAIALAVALAPVIAEAQPAPPSPAPIPAPAPPPPAPAAPAPATPAPATPAPAPDAQPTPPPAPDAQPAPPAPDAQPAPAPDAQPAPAPETAPTPAPQPAPAVVAPVPAPAPAPATEPSLLVGAKLGGIVPLDGLSPFVQGGLEVGRVLPGWQRRLAIFLAIDYTQPTTSHEEQDPRVMGGTYSWKLTEQELGVMAGVMFRLHGFGKLVPYGGIGPRLLLARSSVRDDGGPMISKTTERSTKLGVGIPLGVELVLGPGRAVGELLFQYGTLDHVATGDAHSGALTLGVGYRLFL